MYVVVIFVYAHTHTFIHTLFIYLLTCIYLLSLLRLKTQQGFDAVVVGNIPGGGMSRSASLTLNLLLTMLELNHLTLKQDFQTIELSQASLMLGCTTRLTLGCTTTLLHFYEPIAKLI
jgi:galactokinase